MNPNEVPRRAFPAPTTFTSALDALAWLVARAWWLDDGDNTAAEDATQRPAGSSGPRPEHRTDADPGSQEDGR